MRFGSWHRRGMSVLCALRCCLALLLCGSLLAAHADASTAGASAKAAAAATCPPTVHAEAPPPSDAVAPDRGFLWRISRDGRSSWLFGTLHVGKPAWRRFGPHLTAALRSSDVLALEIDPSDPSLLATLAENRPAASLPAALEARLAKAYERACLRPELLSTLHPVLQATTLIVLEARWLGLDPLYALEHSLSQQARSQGRPVVSLESAAQQKAALVPEDETDTLRLMEQSLSQLEDQSGRRVMARLAEAWESGDLAALEDYERWCECLAGASERAFMRKLNDERNSPLADGIEAQHQQGRRVFAAVGALHMTGPQSLPLLLKQRGFVVERLHFKR
ncbi:MAG TPA: TraB/GumN family protein [Rubrivivax sp.]|nr:TraB/GumN family protein [Rubrivivax sp.]